MEGDARGFRVALVTSELVNERGAELDPIAVLTEGDWGVIQLPAADYPPEVAGPLLAQVAEHTEEFARHGHRLVVVGRHDGLRDALARVGVPPPPAIEPADDAELRDFLALHAHPHPIPPRTLP